MKPNPSIQNKRKALPEGRFFLVRYFFLASFGIFILRALWLGSFFSSNEKLTHIKKTQYHKTSSSISNRGSLFDHRKIPLAISIKLPSLAVNPRVFRPTRQQTKKLSKLLKIPTKKIKHLSNKKNYFAWLKRKVTYSLADKVSKLKIRGLHHTLEPSRFYPGNSSAAHLIGLVGTDDVGLLGLEKNLDKSLSGLQKEVMKLKDARGKAILTSSSSVAPQKPGNHVFLTIDHVIQEITEEALDKMYKKSLAKAAFAIVADPHTGRILAMANRPNFNPNNTKNLIIENTKNLSANMLFEPGSVIKPFVIAAALEQKKTSLEELHDCEKSGVYKISHQASIHDDHPKNYHMTTAEVLIHSSNICAYKIAKKLGKKELYKTFKRFGIGLKTPNLPLPGLHSGTLALPETWKEIRFANLAFGQGLLTTGPEIIRAFSIFANGGFLVEPYLITRIETAEGELVRGPPRTKEKRIFSQEVAEEIRETLLRVVTEGTGGNAKLESFSSAGKTGTAEKFDQEKKSYLPDKRIASFVGFAPALNPHLVAYIVIDEPGKKPYYGGTWAAPVFKDIMDKSLKYLNIAPDKQSEPTKVNLSKQTDHNEQHENKTKL